MSILLTSLRSATVGMLERTVSAGSEASVSSDPDPLTDALHITLAVLYFILLSIITFQIGRIFVNRHRLASFQFVFLSFCFVWMVMRVTLAIIVVVDKEDAPGLPYAVLLPLLVLPLNFQFATYTLLVMFFTRVVYRSQWEDVYKRRVTIAWGIANLIFLIYNTIWIGLVLGLANQDNDEEQRGSIALIMRFIVPAIAFSVLVILLMYYGYRLRRTLQNPQALVSFRANALTSGRITFITVLLVVVFSLRVIYCIVMVYEAFYYDYPAGEQPVFGFIALLISDILPTFAILFFFRNIPRDSLSVEHASGRFPPAFQQTMGGAASSAFGGSKRYTVENARSPLLSPNLSLSDDEGDDDEDAQSYEGMGTYDVYGNMTTQQIIAAMPTTARGGSPYIN